MGTTLTGTTPQDTYDSLIKVTDNGPLSGTAKYLSDGLGNDSALALSTGNIGIGTTSPNLSGSARTLTINAANAADYPTLELASGGVLGLYINGNNSENIISSQGARPLNIYTNGNERLRITSAGNVGIGTSSPTNKLTVKGIIGMLNDEVAAGYSTLDIIPATAIGASANRIAALNTTDIAFETGAAERFRITNNGVTFNGDTAAANALDDYEEGTFTVGIAFGGATTGITYTRNSGTYTKIGRKVTVCADIILSSKGTATGSATVTGLPFTIGVATNFLPVPSFRFAEMSFTGFVQGYGQVGDTYINMENVTSGAGASPLTHVDFEDATQLMVTLTYFV